MIELLTGLDWLSDQFSTTNQRLAVSVAAVGLLLVVLLSYRRLQGWLADRTRPLYADVVTMGVLTGSCLATLSVIMGVWGQTEEVRQLYLQFGLGGEVLARLIFSFVIVVSTYIVARFVRRLLRELLNSASAVTDHQREVSHRLSQVVIWAFSLVVILGVWIDDLSGLLVGAGVLGIVIGMAARQTLGTILAGFVLMFSRPFEIGDWVEIETEEGIVTDISVFNTRIQSFDGEYIMIPNDVVGTSVVTNRSKRGRLRVEVDVGVDYETDVEAAAAVALDAIEDVEAVLPAPEPNVVTKSFDESVILLGVRFWIDRPSARRFASARTAAIGAIKRAFEDEGVKIPYPQRELSGRAETGGFRVSGESTHETATKGSDAETTGTKTTDTKTTESIPSQETTTTRPEDD